METPKVTVSASAITKSGDMIILDGNDDGEGGWVEILGRESDDPDGRFRLQAKRIEIDLSANRITADCSVSIDVGADRQ